MPKRAPAPKVIERGEGAWLLALYQPVTLFSLRMTHATSKGGKTLLVPTPYAIKMALIDACFRKFERDQAEVQAREIFDALKWRSIRILPPAECIVQNTFVKILDHNREGTVPFKSTIAYREFAYFRGQFTIALGVGGLDSDALNRVESLLPFVNYLGKRGSFFQFLGTRRLSALPAGFSIPLSNSSSWQPALYGVVQSMDDFGDSLCKDKDGFDRINTFDSTALTLNKHRVIHDTALPYRRVSSGRHSTRYQRIAVDETQT